MMYFYTAPRTGSGTESSPYRPNIPSGTPWVGSMQGAVYFIATPRKLNAAQGRTEHLPEQGVRTAAEAHGLRYEDVVNWRVAPGEG